MKIVYQRDTGKISDTYLTSVGNWIWYSAEYRTSGRIPESGQITGKISCPTLTPQARCTRTWVNPLERVLLVTEERSEESARLEAEAGVTGLLHVDVFLQGVQNLTLLRKRKKILEEKKLDEAGMWKTLQDTIQDWHVYKVPRKCTQNWTENIFC